MDDPCEKISCDAKKNFKKSGEIFGIVRKYSVKKHILAEADIYHAKQLADPAGNPKDQRLVFAYIKAAYNLGIVVTEDVSEDNRLDYFMFRSVNQKLI